MQQLPQFRECMELGVPALGQLDCFRLLECLLSPCECRASKVKEKGSAGNACAAADALCCEEAANVADGAASAGTSLADTSPGVNRIVATSRARALFSSVQR